MPQRFVCVTNPFGMIQDAFFPSEDGPQAALSVHLGAFEPLRGKCTVFSNLDHGNNGCHAGTHLFLSGVKSAEASSMPDGNISLDQFLARQIAGQTRFPVLNTAAGPRRWRWCGTVLDARRREGAARATGVARF